MKGLCAAISMGGRAVTALLARGCTGVPFSLLLVFLLLQAPVVAGESTGAPANRPIRDKWALLVGVGRFSSPRIPVLKFAAKDARDFRDYLVKEANFAPDHVRLLVDDKATQRRILSELGNKFLARVAKPDDLVVLFFSTHGSPAQADIRGKNFIVAYDSDPDDLFTSGIEMDRIMDSIKSRILSDRVLLVLDACHSGGIDPGAKGIFRSSNFDAELLSQGSGQLVICSSGVDQQSWESKRYQNGVFTRKLLEGLRLKGRHTTLADAFKHVKNSVSDEVQEDYATRQHPTLKSKWNGNDLIVAAQPLAPQVVPRTVLEILEPDSSFSNWILPAQSAAPAPAPKPASKPLPTKPAPGKPPAIKLPGAASDFDMGVKLYNQRDYSGAVVFLSEAVKHADARNPDAHYYLANALVQLRRNEEAIREYKECVRLAPNGRQSAFCLRAAYQLQGREPGVTSTQRTSTATTRPTALQNRTAETKTDDAHSAETVSKIKAALPRITKVSREGPALSEVLNWSLSDQSAYQSEASARKERAMSRLEEAEQLLKKAQSQAHSVIPSARNYGETEIVFLGRVSAGRILFDSLIAPYKEEVQLRSKILADENSIYETCVSAYRTLYRR